MGLDPFVVALAVVGGGVALAALWSGRGPGLFTGRRARLPRRLRVESVGDADVPLDARSPLDYLSDRLERLGFARAAPVARAFGFGRAGQRLLVVPFVHEDEAAFFFMGIQAGRGARSELMLHIFTPLTESRSVETSTLFPLATLKPPRGTDFRVVEDAETVEEIWAHHRRALTAYERKERAPARAHDWQNRATTAYRDWLDAAVRAHRLVLDVRGDRYRVRSPPKSVV